VEQWQVYKDDIAGVERELPGSRRLQTYDPFVWEEMSETDAEGRTLLNQLGYKFEILHQPA
jgi:hypothetical protein